MKKAAQPNLPPELAFCCCDREKHEVKVIKMVIIIHQNGFMSCYKTGAYSAVTIHVLSWQNRILTFVRFLMMTLTAKSFAC